MEGRGFKSINLSLFYVVILEGGRVGVTLKMYGVTK